MKRNWMITFALAMTLSIVGCGSDSFNPTGDGSGSNTSDGSGDGGGTDPHGSGGGGSGSDSLTIPNCTGEDPSLVSDVAPVFENRCGNCHINGKNESGLNLDLNDGVAPEGSSALRSELLVQIDLMDPIDSNLLLKATGNSGHGGGTRFNDSSTDFKTVYCWIEDGAQDN